MLPGNYKQQIRTLSPCLKRDMILGAIAIFPAKSRPAIHGSAGRPQPKSLNTCQLALRNIRVGELTELSNQSGLVLRRGQQLTFLCHFSRYVLAVPWCGHIFAWGRATREFPDEEH